MTIKKTAYQFRVAILLVTDEVAVYEELIQSLTFNNLFDPAIYLVTQSSELEGRANQYEGSISLTIYQRDSTDTFASLFNSLADRVISNGTDYLWFLYNTSAIAATSVAALYEFISKHPKAGIIAGTLLSRDRTYMPSGGLFSQFLQLKPLPFISAQGSPLHWVNSSNFILKASVLRVLRGIDTSYYKGYEMVDLCFRGLQYGYPILLAPKVITEAYINHGRLDTYFKVRNSFLFISKHLRGSNLVFAVCLNVLSLLSQVIDSLRKKDRDELHQVGGGIRDGLNLVLLKLTSKSPNSTS